VAERTLALIRRGSAMRQRRLRLSVALALAGLLIGCAPETTGAAPSSPAAPVSPVSPAPAIIDAASTATVAAPALGNFFHDLQRLEAGQIEHVRILQLGDSHTAGDVLTGKLRALLQERFGNAGRGMMPPGLAFDGLRQVEVSVTQTGRWSIANSLRDPEDGPYGITGFIARSRSRGAGMSVAPAGGGSFDRAGIGFLKRPGGGSFAVLIDDKIVRTISTDGRSGRATSPDTVFIDAPNAHKLTIRVETPGVAFTSWTLLRRGRGVTLDSQGVSSATVALVNRWSPAAVADDLAHLQPSLVILAYGTNEGFQTDLDATGYRQIYASVLAMVRHFAPKASVLIIGPPDGQRADPTCRHSSDETRCVWRTPPTLAIVRHIEQELAAQTGAAFWDWSRLMTMPGGIDAWVRAAPPLARGDHVHFTAAGYERAAGALFDELMADYKAARSPTSRQGRP
jgi:lysophospholipase L1-like esterase